jgi:hypothetical protein
MDDTLNAQLQYFSGLCGVELLINDLSRTAVARRVNIFQSSEYIRIKNLSISGFIGRLGREDRIYIEMNNINFRSWLDDQVMLRVNEEAACESRTPLRYFHQHNINNNQSQWSGSFVPTRNVDQRWPYGSNSQPAYTDISTPSSVKFPMQPLPQLNYYGSKKPPLSTVRLDPTDDVSVYTNKTTVTTKTIISQRSRGTCRKETEINCGISPLTRSKGDIKSFLIVFAKLM